MGAQPALGILVTLMKQYLLQSLRMVVFLFIDQHGSLSSVCLVEHVHAYVVLKFVVYFQTLLLQLFCLGIEILRDVYIL